MNKVEQKRHLRSDGLINKCSLNLLGRLVFTACKRIMIHLTAEGLFRIR